ncbi:syntaxin 6 [Amylocarpus encephaloides]|uniref:t-SNARE affecting a late Golgi compartment protein 1 n=1 Tax=Amylocarpus encephaloides TaxID=45428 RepID=A0A9P8C673_9HELO|nr:syntaxin 6 [Amylocarpus encephaloides]
MMSSTNEEDPFLQVQADVQNALTHTLRPLFTSHLRIRSLSPSLANPELIASTKELTSALSSITEDLSDLLASIEAIQSDPYKFGLEIDEVSRRRRFVDEVTGEVVDMREELAKGSASGSHGGGKGMPGDDGGGRMEGREDYTAEFEQQQQLHMMVEQDQTLDSVFHTVGNLRQQADDMGRELEEQGELLDGVDTLADRVGGRLQTGLGKMGTVIKRNEDGLSSCCIGVLIFVLIILLILVLIL